MVDVAAHVGESDSDYHTTQRPRHSRPSNSDQLTDGQVAAPPPLHEVITLRVSQVGVGAPPPPQRM
jgi:hypothetical protein